jgi:hypothetical protein
MNPSADPSIEMSTWDCHAGDVAFTITAPSAWLSAQRAYLSDFLTMPPKDLDLAGFSIRVHTDDTAFREIAKTITRSPTTSYVEPVPGLVMRESRHPTGRRCYVIATDDVEHQPGAYAVAVQGHDIDLFTHTGTVRPHRYPIRGLRHARRRGHRPGRPVRVPPRRGFFQGLHDDLLDLLIGDRAWGTGPGFVGQSFQPLGHEPVAPLADRVT